MRRRVVASIGLVSSVLLSSRADESSVAAHEQVSQENTTLVDAVASTWLREHQLPSISIAIARGGRLIVAKGYGLADLEHQTPATDRTIYRIGSITKQFSAAAILKLVEQKRLSLDERVGRYVPGLQAAAASVSIRQLLNHTSGIRSFTAIPSFAAKARLDLSDEELLDVFERESLDFEPGTNFLYNNSAYYLIAMIIERIARRPFGDHMRDEVFLPLGLVDTSACDDRKLLPHSRPRVHGGWRNAPECAVHQYGAPQRRRESLVDCARPCDMGRHASHGTIHHTRVVPPHG
jgi:CubicO group peptidase (beta-lactamase class C family)